MGDQTADIDLGGGFVGTFFGWHPDRALNPQWAGRPDVERAGLLIEHPRPDGAAACHAAVNFPSMAGLVPEKAIWQIESWEPLTLSPSVLCLRCGAHGFVRNGRWVRA